jgi:hypothetical protein
MASAKAVSEAAQLRLFDLNGPRPHRLRQAVDETVKALEDTGRLERCDGFLVELARVAADGVDELDGDVDRLFHRAQLLKIAYGCEQAMRRLVPPIDDAFDQLMAVASGENVEEAGERLVRRPHRP